MAAVIVDPLPRHVSLEDAFDMDGEWTWPLCFPRGFTSD
jgi:hypothetical protein